MDKVEKAGVDARPEFAEGDRVEVWALLGRRMAWVPAVVTGTRASMNPNEDFLRIDVEATGLPYVWKGAHPDCVRHATP